MEKVAILNDIHGNLYLLNKALEYLKDKKNILIERLAGAICEDLFAQFPPIQSIKVRITKENPPINGHYKNVGIELERSR